MQLQSLECVRTLKILDRKPYDIDSRGIVGKQLPDYGYRGSSLQQHGCASESPRYPLDLQTSGAE